MNAIKSPTGCGYSYIIEHIAEVKEIAKIMMLSNMYGLQDADQAFVVAADCIFRGVPLLEYQARNHLIMGKPSMKYDAMLADFNSVPGNKSVVIEKTPEKAAILLIQGKTETEFSLTWEDAKKEAFVYVGKESKVIEALQAGKADTLQLKDKYATPRSRAIMLFARVVSDAVRSCNPEVTAGRYTPEEIEDFAVLTLDGQVFRAPKAIESKPEVKADPKPTPEPEPAKEVKPEPVAKVEPIDEVKPGVEHSQSVDGPITDDQINAVKQLIREGGDEVKDAVKAKLAAMGTKLAGLTFNQGRSLFKALEAKELERWADEQLAAAPS